MIKASKLIAKIGKTHCYASIKNALIDMDNPGTLGDNVRHVATQTEIKE